MTDQVFPQHGDEPDAANFAQVYGNLAALGGASGRGWTTFNSFQFTNVDYGVPEVDIDNGSAIVGGASYDTSSPDFPSTETREITCWVVEKDSETLSLTDNDVNHIFIDANIGTDDSPNFVANTNNNTPSNASLKIGEVDTNNNTSSQRWGERSQGVKTYPDVTAIESERDENRLLRGELVMARNGGSSFDFRLYMMDNVSPQEIPLGYNTSTGTTSISSNSTATISTGFSDPMIVSYSTLGTATVEHRVSGGDVIFNEVSGNNGTVEYKIFETNIL